MEVESFGLPAASVLLSSIPDSEVPLIVQKALLLCSQKDFAAFAEMALPVALDRSRLTGEIVHFFPVVDNTICC